MTHIIGQPDRRILGFHHDTTLALVRAMPHSCGAAPGRTCNLPWHKGSCTAPTASPMDLAVTAP
ncbi:hypothetical protein [Actinoplanes sp. NPDC026623]|uniref:hypothetical protein n=1 Tax=Actinoplanes sp. NPDC026623 TaxID=3155610 RepID=UPI0033FB34C0